MTTLQQKRDWQVLVESMREELRECAWLLTLMNTLQKAILQRDLGAVTEVTSEIEVQVSVVEQCASLRSVELDTQAKALGLQGNPPLRKLIPLAPPHLWPLINALCEEAEALQSKIERRVKQNSSLLSRSGEFAAQMLETLRPTSVIRTYNRAGIIGRSSALSGSVIRTAV